MVVGFTMVKVIKGYEDEAYLSLKNTNGVKEVYRILGEYGFFVVLQAEHGIHLHDLIDMIKNIFSVTAIWHVLVSSQDDSEQVASSNASSLEEPRSLSQHDHQVASHPILTHELGIRFTVTEIS